MIDSCRIAVVVPAYLVADHICAVLQAMPESIDRIYVVDDASPDDSSLRVEHMKHQKVELLKHERNQGVGGATITGVKAALAAGFDIVVKCDGDGQMNPQLIPSLLKPILDGTADHAKGSRFLHFEALKEMPKWRLVGNACLTLLTKLASGYWNILDPVNGFLATRAEILKKMPLSNIARGYFFETDLLIRLNILEARVIDVPFPAHYADEKSSMSLAKSAVTFPVQLLAGLVRRIFWRYIFYDVSPIAVFTLGGGLLAAFGVLFGAYHWIKNARLGIPTPIGTVMLAVLPFMVGFQLLLQSLVLDIQNTPRPGKRSPMEDPSRQR